MDNKEMLELFVEVWREESGRRLAQLRKAQLRHDSYDIAWYHSRVASANRLAAKYRRQLKEVVGK